MKNKEKYSGGPSSSFWVVLLSLPSPSLSHSSSPPSSLLASHVERCCFRWCCCRVLLWFLHSVVLFFPPSCWVRSIFITSVLLSFLPSLPFFWVVGAAFYAPCFLVVPPSSSSMCGAAVSPLPTWNSFFVQLHLSVSVSLLL